MFAIVTSSILIFQGDPSQNVLNQNLNFWLVIAGILLIFLCMLALFVPHVKSLLTKPQEFSGLGVNMRVSILTVFVLMGFILSLSSFALQWQGFMTRENDYKNKIGALESEKKQLEEQQTRARKFDMTIVLRPKGLNEVLNTDEWSCVYYLEDSSGRPSRAISAPLVRAKEGKSFKVTLEGITPETRIYSIKLKKGKKSWEADGLFPLREGAFEAEPEEEGDNDENTKD
jgi:hypothetical protein